MPDIGDDNLPSTRTEIVFDSSVKGTPASPYFKIIDFQGAKGIIVAQRALTQPNNAETITAQAIQGTVTNPNNAVDKNSSTFATLSDTTGTTDPIIRFDFGSIAVRSVSIKRSGDGNESDTKIARWRTSNDAVAWSTETTLDTYTTAGLPQQFSRFITSLSFRYLEIRFQFFAASPTRNYNIFEIWSDLGDGFGISNLSFEIFDEARNEWITYIPTTEFTQQNSVDGTNERVQIGENSAKKYMLPSGVNQIRARLNVVDGGVNTSVFVQKVRN